MTVCAGVSTTHPGESLVSVMKLSPSIAVCFHIGIIATCAVLLRFQECLEIA